VNKDTQLLLDALNEETLQVHFVLQYSKSMGSYIFYKVEQEDLLLITIAELEKALSSMDWYVSKVVNIEREHTQLLDDVFKKTTLQNHFIVPRDDYANKHECLNIGEHVFKKVADKIAITGEKLI